ncbi:hypothetical protein V6N13_109291 [Hibiscus sabdariffa]|uniref:Non-haem dioxygenase N-terminal domain-containing protein n=1 Tax=Hibiscus sabdariffa TaxID=183260 RepID=A0ABR2FP65_9ROSI
MKDIKEFDQSKNGVKGLIDSSNAAIPKIFIQPPTLDPRRTDTSNILVIGLEGIRSESHCPEMVVQIKKAANKWAFFQVINHGIPETMLEETIRAVKSFHEQPSETKAVYYSREDTLN